MLVGEGVAGGHLNFQLQLVLTVGAGARRRDARRHQHGDALAAWVLAVHLWAVEDGAECLVLDFAQVARAHCQCIGGGSAHGYRGAAIGCAQVGGISHVSFKVLVASEEPAAPLP